MRIVHLYDGHEQVYGGRGSVPGVVWNIARETATANHDVTVLERRWDDLPATAEYDGVAFHRLNLRTGADKPWIRVPYEEMTSPGGAVRLVGDRTNFAFAALRWLYEMEFDILHVHLPFAANVIATVAPQLRDRMVYTAHLGELRLDLLEDSQGDSSDESGLDVPAILSTFSPDVYLAKRVAATTVLNPGIKSAFVGEGVDASTLHVIPNGVDIERFGNMDATAVERVRKKYGIGDCPVVLFVGTVMPRKGVVELVRAFDQLVNGRGRDIHLVLVGETGLDEAYVEKVESFISRDKLDNRVTMPGFVPSDDLPALYRLADVLTVPSLEEGFGMTAIEAMAAGTPVVGSGVGGLPQVIESGQTGLLTEPGDVDGLATAIEDMLTQLDRDDVRDMVRQKAMKYSWESVATQFETVYEGIQNE